MKPKVFIAKPIPVQVEEYIAEHCDYKKWMPLEDITREQMFKEIGDVEGILTNCHTGGQVNDEFIDHAPKLKVVSNISVGHNNYEVEVMRRRNVMGTNTPGVLDDTVADTVLALMLDSSRRISELDRFTRDGNWVEELKDEYFGRDVHHATLGIIGMGRVGEAIAKRAVYGFDMNVQYYNRNTKPETEEKLGVKYANLDDLLRTSDFVVLMTPLTKDTYHLMGEREFGLMKEAAYFINASRGQTVDENALIGALQQKKIAGAGLDVYEKEPIDPNNPLLKIPNVVLAPHIGSATAKTRFDMSMVAAQNMVKALLGEVPPNLVK
jgi:glyoxylate/hydroxypyruvate/2-ketogluconate reductase